MYRRLSLLFLAALVFVGAVFTIKQVGAPALTAVKKNLDLKQFEILTDDTEPLKIGKEVLLSSPLIIFGKGDTTPFTPTQIVAETNRQRLANGIPALQDSSKLAAAAEAKVRDLFERQYFEHISPFTGGGPELLANNVNYEYVSLGENLALGNFGDEGALVDAWMNSPGHRANILRSQFQEIGIAVGRGEYQGRQVLIAVQEFGRPLASCPYVDASLKKSVESDKKNLANFVTELSSLKAEIDALEKNQESSMQEYEDKVSAYNAKINDYNTLVNSIRQKTTTYNNQVKSFNNCLRVSV